MRLGRSRWSPWHIIAAHYGTFVDARTNQRRYRYFLEMALPPAAVLAGALLLDARLSGTASGALLAASGLFGAFLFSVMLRIAQRAMEWAQSVPEPGADASQHARFLQEVSANAGYAALVAIAAVVAYVVAALTAGDPTLPAASRGAEWPLRASSAVGLALGVHLMFTLLLVMKRIFALTRERLDRARTGADDLTRVRHRRVS